MAEPLSREEINRHIEILNRSQDSGLATASAVALAHAEDREALAALGRALARGEFLNRLDDAAGQRMENLMAVFLALAEHPGPAVSQLCVSVYGSEEFRSILARLNLLLGVLAHIKPVSDDAAQVFRDSSAAGFAEVNGPLLIVNESPLALQVFEQIIAGDWVESYVKVDILHNAVLSHRTRLPVLRLCARLLQRELAPDVWAGVVETLFDEQSRRWFGPAMGAPMAPPWQAATTEALQFLVNLAGRLPAGSLDENLQEAVQATVGEVEAILRSRRE